MDPSPTPQPANAQEWLILSFAETREQRKELGKLIEAVEKLTETVQSFAGRIERLEAFQQSAAPILHDMDKIRVDNRKTLATFTVVGTVFGYVAGAVSYALHLLPPR